MPVVSLVWHVAKAAIEHPVAGALPAQIQLPILVPKVNGAMGPVTFTLTAERNGKGQPIYREDPSH